MRNFISIVESLGESHQSGAGLWQAIKDWANNTNSIETKIAYLLANRNEASKYLLPSYRMLYRAQYITDDQRAELTDNGKVMIGMRRLASWTSKISVARMFGEDPETIIIAMPGKLLKPFIDLGIYLDEHFDAERIKIAYDNDEYELHDMQREREVIVEHTKPLTVSLIRIRK